METLNDIPVMAFPDGSSWEQWLNQNYGLQSGVWVKMAKKDSGVASVSRFEALDAALCYGWIDGQVRPLDEKYYLQKYTPRRARSLWSKINIGKVEVLIADGRMRASGLEQIKTAQADGRWGAAYESPKNATMPDDLLAEFELHPAAKSYYDSLSKTNQYNVLWQLMTAKKPATRANRLQKLVSALEAGTAFR